MITADNLVESEMTISVVPWKRITDKTVKFLVESASAEEVERRTRSEFYVTQIEVAVG